MQTASEMAVELRSQIGQAIRTMAGMDGTLPNSLATLSLIMGSINGMILALDIVLNDPNASNVYIREANMVYADVKRRIAANN